jgi:hypothetical protein
VDLDNQDQDDENIEDDDPYENDDEDDDDQMSMVGKQTSLEMDVEDKSNDTEKNSKINSSKSTASIEASNVNIRQSNIVHPVCDVAVDVDLVSELRFVPRLRKDIDASNNSHPNQNSSPNEQKMNDVSLIELQTIYDACCVCAELNPDSDNYGEDDGLADGDDDGGMYMHEMGDEAEAEEEFNNDDEYDDEEGNFYFNTEEVLNGLARQQQQQQQQQSQQSQHQRQEQSTDIKSRSVNKDFVQ